MPSLLEVSQLRTLQIAAQRLHAPPTRLARKEDLLAAIRHMGILQIDTIHVVNRSPYLVLYARLGAFPPVWLEQLLAEGKLFEYWSHEASFLPIEDYALYRHVMLGHAQAGRGASRVQRGQAWLQQHAGEVARVRAALAAGPVRARDFERTDGQKGTWWNWKFEKEALERLFNVGEVMVRARENFQRVYDLRERVLPGWNDDHALPAAQARREMVARSVRALGAARAAWVPDYYRLSGAAVKPALHDLLREGEIFELPVSGFREPLLVHRDNLELLEAVRAGDLRARRTELLSPFDPLVWDRRRLSETFGFEYRIECYTPEPKRRYGYFTLPILHHDALVGRLDAKAHRREGVLEVKALHLEPGVNPSARLLEALARTLRGFGSWHGTPEVRITRTDPIELQRRLEDVMQAVQTPE
ncbi:hypothetical protein HNR42_003233 [Deinobacterium chartae]|uniref:Winged helix-turn-helix domain-containing protein n=1 Tax=Deinobacterium chartae TaxID=521158 RepID=A0A841I7I9_9DEIO|nr:crosslink repair DNA glycosylase YcaQ family protein [Deinobacterium chartae]MBB6099775.1 hypothetical protein [Deinobacterium chartae]